MILHLSSQQTGGAAIAALRIHRALLEAGVDSHFLAGSGAADPALNIDVVPKVYERFWVRGLHNIGISTTQYRKWQRTRAQYELPDTVLGGIRSDYRLGDHPLVKQAEVIHLHWVTGMFDWPDFFQQVKKPIVWTMHDMNPFMGAFHYEGDMARASQRSLAFERKLRNEKTRLLQSHGHITCVAPSRWLSEKAGASEVLGKFTHRVIPNAVDTEVFRPYPPEFGRKIFDLPADKKILLVVAERLDDCRKGMDLLGESLRARPLDENWEIVTVGAGSASVDCYMVHNIGRINDERLLALLYSTADLFVIPSREDNLPNTILESLSCGTPVVGFPAGGVPEVVETPVSGVIADAVSSEALASALRAAASMKFDRDSIRKLATSRFAPSLIAQQYLSVYRNVLAQ